MDPNEARTEPKWGTGGSSTAPVGPREAQINSSRPQVKPNGAQMELRSPTGVQTELKWGSYEVPSTINRAIPLIALRLHVHFDTVFEQKKAPKSSLIPELRVLSIVATKQLDVLRSITFYSRKAVFSCGPTSKSGTINNTPT